MMVRAFIAGPVWENQDYRDDFRDDGIGVADLQLLIEHAFAGVKRGEGVGPRFVRR